jgi:hypothetical protein
MFALLLGDGRRASGGAVGSAADEGIALTEHRYLGKRIWRFENGPQGWWLERDGALTFLRDWFAWR